MFSVYLFKFSVLLLSRFSSWFTIFKYSLLSLLAFTLYVYRFLSFSLFYVTLILLRFSCFRFLGFSLSWLFSRFKIFTCMNCIAEYPKCPVFTRLKPWSRQWWHLSPTHAFPTVRSWRPLIWPMLGPATTST